MAVPRSLAPNQTTPVPIAVICLHPGSTHRVRTHVDSTQGYEGGNGGRKSANVQDGVEGDQTIPWDVGDRAQPLGCRDSQQRRKVWHVKYLKHHQHHPTGKEHPYKD